LFKLKVAGPNPQLAASSRTDPAETRTRMRIGYGPRRPRSDAVATASRPAITPPSNTP
jgi:hypothetical protein